MRISLRGHRGLAARTGLLVAGLAIGFGSFWHSATSPARRLANRVEDSQRELAEMQSFLEQQSARAARADSVDPDTVAACLPSTWGIRSLRRWLWDTAIAAGPEGNGLVIDELVVSPDTVPVVEQAPATSAVQPEIALPGSGAATDLSDAEQQALGDEDARLFAATAPASALLAHPATMHGRARQSELMEWLARVQDEHPSIVVRRVSLQRWRPSHDGGDSFTPMDASEKTCRFELQLWCLFRPENEPTSKATTTLALDQLPTEMPR